MKKQHILAPNGVCFTFWNTGRCKDGAECKYKHQTPDQPVNTGAAPGTRGGSPQQRGIPSFRRALELEIKNQHGMRRLVLAALGEGSKTDVILQLTSREHSPKLEQILESGFVTNASSHANRVSFHRVIVPLCLLLTSDEVSNSPHVSGMKMLYTMVARQAQFFPRLIRCAETVVMENGELRGDPVQNDEPSNMWDPTDGVKHVVKPICTLHVLIQSRVTDAPADPMSMKIQTDLERLVQRIRNISGASDIDTLLKRSRELIEGFERAPEVQNRARRHGQELLDHQLAMQMELGVDIPLEIQPGPGETRPGGPRHNNDFVDYRQIQIVPTGEEILCDIEPYLPKVDEKVEHVFGETDLYLDRQFRLLREDMLGEVRRGIQGFFRQNGLRRLGEKNSRLRTEATARHHDSSVNLMVYRRVRCVGVATNFFRGLGLVVECDQLRDMGVPAATSNQKKAMKDFWESGKGSRLLQTDSLVCIALRVSEDGSGAERLCFGIISERNIDDLCKADRIKFTIRILSANLAQDVLHLLNAPRSPDINTEKRESVMLQVRGHFFAGYEPILRSLQMHSVATIPFADVFVTKSLQALQAPPAYLAGRNYRPFDLSCILKTREVGDLSFDMSRPELLEGFLKQHEHLLVLDDTQIDAFAMALTRRVALIQGPPGTGKTYVGISVVRALLANSAGPSTSGKWSNGPLGITAILEDDKDLPCLNPLVCICYTNHALDQFLEGLVKEGAVRLEQVVRIGSRSQSEALQERNLEKLKQGKFSKTEYSAYKQSQQSATELSYEIEKRQRRVSQGATDDDVMEWLEVEYGHVYGELFDDNDEGFMVVGGSKYVLRSWLGESRIHLGCDLDDFAKQRACDVLESSISPWDWSKEDANLVWRYGQLQVEADAVHSLRALLDEYKQLVEKNQELQDGLRLRILRSAKVVGLTTSGAARNQSLFRALRPRVIVCEEAGEVLESHILAAVTGGAEHVILIGDHLQLRPKVAEYGLSVASGLKYDLDKSLFERCIEEFGESEVGTKTFSTLLTQRRMLPPISKLVRITLYPQLLDGANVTTYPRLMGFAHPLWFFSHPHRESKNESQSFTNDFEANMVVGLVRYAIRHGYLGERLAVLTPYVGQLLKLRNLLSNSRMLVVLGEADKEALDARGLLDDEDDHEKDEATTIKNVTLRQSIRLATVDNFQGEEADFVIISTVRNNTEGRTGFLREDNRVNVMLSRAKHGMLILGSMETIERARRPAKMFRSVCRHLNENGLVGDYVPLKCLHHGKETHVRTVADVLDDGGCNQVCSLRMKCGHSCKRNCHPDDPNHLATASCREPCALVLECGHKCSTLCRVKPCPPCTVPVQKQLKCGHFCMLPCSKPTTDVQICKMLIENALLGCGHRETLTCDDYQKSMNHMNAVVPQDHPQFRCGEMCGAQLPCGHACSRQCGECSRSSSLLEGKLLTKKAEAHWTEHGFCKSVCDRALFCGHRCAATPCHGQSECPPCSKRCEIKCGHSACGGQCKEPCALCVESCLWECTCEKRAPPCSLPCSYPCSRLPCSDRCSKVLPCGHRCPSVCGETCPDVRVCQVCGTDANKDQVSDLIMFSNYRDVDLSSDPIIALKCGHIFTTSSLDGHLQMNLFFERDGRDDGSWIGVKPLELKVPRPTCPQCKVPISGVFRYGRILNLAAVELAEQKYLVKCNIQAAKFAKDEQWLGLRIGANNISKRVLRDLRNVLRDCERECSGFEENDPLLRLHSLADRSLVKIEPSRQSQVQLLISWMGLLRLKIQATVVEILHHEAKKEDAHTVMMGECAGALVRMYGALDKAQLLCEQFSLKTLKDRANDVFCGSCLVIVESLQGIPADGGAELQTQCVEKWISVLEQMSPETRNPLHVKASSNWRARLTGGPFYQEITTEEKKQILEAMVRDVGSGVGSFGGHWFTCPNGHVYTIGECGGAMQRSLCPECGAEVGGENHTRVAGNLVADEFLRETGFDPNRYN